MSEAVGGKQLRDRSEPKARSASAFADMRQLVESSAVPSERILVLRQGSRLSAEAALGSSAATLN